MADLDAKVVHYQGAFGTDAGVDVSIEGYACHLTKGKYGYLLMLVSYLGMMDDRYLKSDFWRLLDSFRVP